MTFYQKFEKKCVEKRVRPSRAALDAGIAKSTVTSWRNGTLPTDMSLQLLAVYFGCNPDDLRGDEETKMPAAENGSGQDEEELMEEIMQTIRSRPEMRMLFDAGKKATPETVRQTARFLEGLAKGENAD